MNEQPASFDERLESLSAEQTELLNLLFEDESRRIQDIPSYARQPVGKAAQAPASSAQQRLWFIDQLEGGSASYQVPIALRLRGPLDRSALQMAMDSLVQRHEVLRTVLSNSEGVPWQVIVPEARFELRSTDLGSHSPEERERQAQLLRLKEAHDRFDLEVGPLIRGQLLRLQSDDHLLLITMHHCISDGASIEIVLREIVDLYRSHREGDRPRLKPLPIQYADYAQWQRDFLQGHRLNEELSYWVGQLRDAPPQLDLPTDRLRSAMQSYHGKTVPVSFGVSLTVRIRDLARRHGLTPFMVLYAGWAILLSRLTGQDDIVIGTPVANRQRPEFEDLIGFFVNTLVLRVKVQSGQTAEEFLEQVRQVTLGAYQHQDLPFEKLVEVLQPARSMGRNPIFQVMLGLHDGLDREVSMSGLRGYLEPAVDEPAMFDLLLSFEDRSDEIAGTINYAADLFDRATVQRWMACYRVLLEAIVTDTTVYVRDLPILPESERYKVISAFNATYTTYPREKLIHLLFEEQVRATPEAVAVLHEDRLLTYDRLNAQANQLARILIVQGVGPDRFVGICMERGLDMIVALLATLKAGGAYVPLDPTYPPERLAFILKDTALEVVLTQERLRCRVPETRGRVIALDNEWGRLAMYSTDNLDPVALGLTSHHLAYIIYTSGSTGHPKGVAIEHRNTVNLIFWARAAMGPDVFSRTLHSTSLNFDLSVYECFVPLATGGSIRVVENALALTGGPDDVTLINTVPSAIQGLLEAAHESRTVRVVNLAGEPLQRELTERIFANIPADCVCNLYGPSETTTYSTWIAMLRSEGFKRSIGRPIANTQVYILGPGWHPVPIGVAGEIFIGGAGVARGYLNRPELTGERFLPDPFNPDPHGRMYRTGDLGRWTAGGTIEYLGRNDHQVKIRGYRIELGEIESRLRAHAQVKEVVVLTREDVRDEKTLVAYVISRDPLTVEGTATAEALRSDLKAVLPEYMLPGAFVILERFPLTPNGKLDRHALPAPESGVGDVGSYEPPQGDVEETLAEIWQGLLQRERIGRRENFFELGGHSLLGTRVLSRVLDLLQVELPVRALFDAPTIQSLGAHIQEKRRLQRHIPPLVPQPRGRIIPASYAQERLWFLDQMRLVGSAYNMPFALRLTGELQEEALERSFGELVRRHEALRTRFGVEDGVPCQLIDAPESFRMLRTDLRDVADLPERERQLNDLMHTERQHIFDLREGKLMRVVLVQLASREHALLVTVHHILMDGWSLGVLIHELSALYGACIAGRTSPLLELAVQYADYAIWQRQWMQGEELQTQLQYWIDRLGGAPPQLHLPTNRPRPEVESFKGATLRFELPKCLREALEGMAREQGATLFMVMLAAYQLLLARYSGQQDIVVGSPIAGRTSRQTENLVGLFVNTLVLRTQVSKGQTFYQLLRQVKEVTLGAYAHQDLPFEKLVVELRPERKLAHQPIFQVALALQNYPEEQWSLAGLDWSWMSAEHLTTHFDLTLFLVRSTDGMSGVFEYAIDLFDEASIERMAGHFHRLLEQIAADPRCPLERYSLITGQERLQLLYWNGSPAGALLDTNVVSLLERHARQVPDAPAVTSATSVMTYHDLNSCANRLSRRLREHGIGVESHVGVCMSRGVECLLAFYAILKAGAVYVPLDPAYPSERLKGICMDAAVGHILIKRGESIALDTSNMECIPIGGECISNPGIASDGDTPHWFDLMAPAYAIYTSGSTGKPKGVLLHHLGLANVVAAQRAAFALVPTDRVAQLASISFDASVFEFVLALGAGACLCLGSREELLPGPAMTGFLRGHSVSVVTITPSALSALQPDQLPCLRMLIVAGEDLPVELARTWSTSRLVFNAYGPTETTIWATVHACSATAFGRRVPIGRPIENARSYVLDTGLNPVAVGEIGELYVGGAGVAMGYINRPDLTADRFLPDPNAQAGRMYRTGDLARWNPDGTLEFLGRADGQVKIRGHRIEPAEIEAILLEHPAVKQAVVMAREDAHDERRLVSYVVADRGVVEAGTTGQSPGNLRTVVVEAWESLYEDTYARHNSDAGPSFVGWNSSYTDAPIPEDEMQEWLSGTVERLRSLRPRRVLEIGCGVGLVLQEVAPQCEVYVGADLSASALEKLSHWKDGRADLRHVQLLHRSATELQDLAPGSFDTVILNSVVQYFPDVDYLIGVLQGAVRLLSLEGNIFIGDVRDLGLLPTFQSAVQLSKATASLSVGLLRSRVARAITQEKELAIAPDLFRALPGRVPGISAVEVHLKRGRSINELFQYRYDVVLNTGEKVNAQPVFERLDWKESVDSVAALRSALRQQRWGAVQICAVPNRRLSRDAAGFALIENADERLDVGTLRRQMSALQFKDVDPEEIWDAAHSNHFDVTLSPGAIGCFDVLLLNRAYADAVPRKQPIPLDPRNPWNAWANDPLEAGFRRQLVPQLRDYLKGWLPDYMVPSAWTILNALPLTPNGKVNRHALPASDFDTQVSISYDRPQGEVEEALAEIWQQLLQVEQIGRRDSFFELGGHSLLAIKALFRINKRFGCNLKVMDVYRSATLRELAGRIHGMATVDERIDLSDEAVLAPHIVALPGLPRTPAAAVMLTGCTGFVGRFLLAQLLQENTSKIYCLVRARSLQQARKRLHTTMIRWDLWSDDYESRLVVLPGDLSLPRLGLDESTYGMLCREVDSIYHCAISMNHLETYTMAKQTNVDGVREILRLATRDKPKLVNYISTLGVFTETGSDVPRVVDESTPIEEECHWNSGGYAASKWVGEKIIIIADQRGIPCNIFRLGLVWADTQLGRYDELQRGYRILKSCLLSGRGISDYRFEMPPTPVDYVVRAVAFLANRYNQGHGSFHISLSRQMSGGLFERCSDQVRPSLRLTPFFDWIREIKRLHEEGQTLPVVPLIEFAFAMDEQTFRNYQQRESQSLEKTRFDCVRTQTELRHAGIVEPVFDEHLLRQCIAWMLLRDGDLQHLLDESGRARCVAT